MKVRAQSIYFKFTLALILVSTQGFAQKAKPPKVGSKEYIAQENAASAKLDQENLSRKIEIKVIGDVPPPKPYEAFEDGYPAPVAAPAAVAPASGSSSAARGPEINSAEPNVSGGNTGTFVYGQKKEVPEASPAPWASEPMNFTAKPAPVANSADSTGDITPVQLTDTATVVNNELVGARGPSGVETSPAFNCEIMTGNAAPYTQSAQGKVFAACDATKQIDKSCFGVFETTNQMCHTEQNESITSAVTMIQTLMSVASGVTNACNNFGKAMDLAKKTMALYTTACSGAQIMCNSKCGGTVKALGSFVKTTTAALKELETTCNGLIGEANASATAATAANNAPAALNFRSKAAEIKTNCTIVGKKFSEGITFASKEATPAGGVSSAGAKAKICAVSIPAILGTAIINLGALAQSKSQSDACEAATKAEEDKKVAAEQACTNPANKDREDCKPKSTTVDCGKAENTDKPICICKANPRMKGCEGVSTALATNSTLGGGNAGGLGGGRGPSGNLITAPTAAANGAGGFPASSNGSGNDGGGTGGGGGGSSAGLSGGGGGASGNAEKAAGNGDSKDSANILGGDSGGGGGGGFRSGGFGGYSSPEYRSKLNAFAAKNGIGKIAGNSWTAQVTGTGGKSNFDKIRDRYQENKSTLLGGR